jgi:hypothetical protein
VQIEGKHQDLKAPGLRRDLVEEHVARQQRRHRSFMAAHSGKELRKVAEFRDPSPFFR